MSALFSRWQHPAICWYVSVAAAARYIACYFIFKICSCRSSPSVEFDGCSTVQFSFGSSALHTCEQFTVTGNRQFTLTGNSLPSQVTLTGNRQFTLTGNRQFTLSGNRQFTLTGNSLPSQVTDNLPSQVTDSLPSQVTDSLPSQVTMKQTIYSQWWLCAFLCFWYIWRFGLMVTRWPRST